MTSLSSRIDATLDGQRLLDHPFYRRWTAGTLSIDELREYATQYRSIERSQPRWLAGITAALEPGSARASVQRVLDDELSDGSSHADLFDRFATSIGAPDDAPPSPATSALLRTLDALVDESPVAGLGGLLAYEVQSSAVSSEKALGLRRHFNLDGDATAFWDTHAELDQRHSAWLQEAVTASGMPEERAVTAAGTAASAWWAFLDEREASSA
jgi:pyrroloquinoline-quinone synthase